MTCARRAGFGLALCALACPPAERRCNDVLIGLPSRGPRRPCDARDVHTRAHLLLLLPLLVADACASVQRGEDGRVHVLEQSLLDEIPIAASYGAPLPAVADDAHAAELRARFEAGLPPAVRERFVHDPRLDHFARVQAIAYGEAKQRLSADLQARVLWRLGVTTSLAGGRRRWASGKDRFASVDEFVVDTRGHLPANGRYRYGLTRVFSGKRVAVSMVWVNDLLELLPIEKTVAPGGIISLRGRFRDDVTRPQLHILEGDVVRTVAIKLGADKSFSEDIVMGKEPGVRFVALHTSVTDSTESRKAYVWLPVFVAAAEPQVPPVEALGSTLPTVSNVSGMLDEMKLGLPARDARLDDIAASIAATANDVAMPVAPLCTKGWSWQRLNAETLEEMRWSIERSPNMLAQLRTPKSQAGLAVKADESGVTTVLLKCEALGTEP